MMRTIFVVLITLFFASNVSAQKFKKEGLRIVTKEKISEYQLSKILTYNFDDYRKQDHSSIIKIIDGPTIELFSISEMKTGIKPTSNGAIKTKVEMPHHESTTEEAESTHYKELSLIKVTTINVFNATTNAAR